MNSYFYNSTIKQSNNYIMKKILLVVLAIAATATFNSCTGPEGPRGPEGTSVLAEVFEIRNVNFVGQNGNYSILYNLNPALYLDDMVLVYRRAGVSNGNDIWESLPKTYYFDNGAELDFNFDFTVQDIVISLGYTDTSVLMPQYLNNQLFRVVIIPGNLTNKLNVNLTDYHAVIKAYGIDDSQVK